MNEDTIFALSSGSLPSGVAVIRISGPLSRLVADRFGLGLLKPRMAVLRKLVDQTSQEMLDQVLVLWFPGPGSFTGEDCLELHAHGGKAVIAKVLSVLGGIDGLRMAEAGEFSRRAFENGKLDLTEVEGLSDLLASETEAQRQQAIELAEGRLSEQLRDWRQQIIRCRAHLEAEFDFSDEDDVPDSMVDLVREEIGALIEDIERSRLRGRLGEIIRDGFRVVLTGAPNSGKSSVINALAGRDIAIVSEEAGTTRDVIECAVDLDGYLVRLMDTAGVRETESAVEAEGIRRTRMQAGYADLVIWLSPVDDPRSPDEGLGEVCLVTSKSDLGVGEDGPYRINTVEESGLDPLVNLIREKISAQRGSEETALISRERHRIELDNSLHHIRRGLDIMNDNPVLASEELRIAGDCFGRITGRIDVEDLLDVIFSEFCVGK